VSPIRSLARPLMAGMYVVDGASALKSPGGRVDAVRAAGLSEPEKLVQVNAATMLVGGLALGAGKLPRLSALALAATMVPTTYVGHAFWSEDDEGARAMQRMQFLKNLSMLGGLLLAAADTGGRESLPHAAGRVSRRTQKKAAKAAKKAEKRLHS
jgi:putative oxidoreductase